MLGPLLPSCSPLRSFVHPPLTVPLTSLFSSPQVLPVFHSILLTFGLLFQEMPPLWESLRPWYVEQSWERETETPRPRGGVGKVEGMSSSSVGHLRETNGWTLEESHSYRPWHSSPLSPLPPKNNSLLFLTNRHYGLRM